MITLKEMYATLTQLVIHAESISWNRLYNFLVCNSILLLAWATICASKPNPAGKVAMLVLCFVGAISGIVWAELGRRGREYLDHYGNHAKKLEETINASEPGLPKGLVKGSNPEEKVWPFEFSVKGPSYGKSRYILTWGPCVFMFLYAVLIVITFFV